MKIDNQDGRSALPAPCSGRKPVPLEAPSGICRPPGGTSDRRGVRKQGKGRELRIRHGPAQIPGII